MAASDVLMKTAGGALKGGMSGGPQGAAVGAGLSLATGLLQEFKANKLKKAADSAYPELVDPNQASFLAEMDQKRKSMETGAAFQTGMEAIDSGTEGINQAVARNTNGDVGSTIQSLLMAQRGANNAKNQVLANGQNAQMGYDQMYGGLLNQISARKLQLQLQRSQQNLAEWSKMKQSGNQNTMAGAAGVSSILDSLGGGNSGGGVDQPVIADNLQQIGTNALPVNDISNMALAAV